MESRELMVLVPALVKRPRGQASELLVKGLVGSEHAIVTEASAGTGELRRLRVAAGDTTREIDIAETYWRDLVPTMADEPVRTKVVRGGSLLIWWTFSKIWEGVGRRKYVTIGLLVSLLALLAWYYGIVALFLQALVNDPDVTGAVGSGAGATLGVLQAVASWKVWAVATLLMGLIPMGRVVDTADFTKRYLTNEPAGRGAKPLNKQIVARVRDSLLAAMKDRRPADMTVVAHSFGCVVALDVLADLPLPPGWTVRLVTLGSPLELLTKRAGWLSGEVKKVINEPWFIEWVDVTMVGDWYASGSDVPEDARCREVEIPPSGTFIDKLRARPHDLYFGRAEAQEAVLQVGAR